MGWFIRGQKKFLIHSYSKKKKFYSSISEILSYCISKHWEGDTCQDPFQANGTILDIDIFLLLHLLYKSCQELWFIVIIRSMGTLSKIFLESFASQENSIHRQEMFHIDHVSKCRQKAQRTAQVRLGRPVPNLDTITSPNPTHIHHPYIPPNQTLYSPVPAMG